MFESHYGSIYLTFDIYRATRSESDLDFRVWCAIFVTHLLHIQDIFKFQEEKRCNILEFVTVTFNLNQS